MNKLVWRFTAFGFAVAVLAAVGIASMPSGTSAKPSAAPSPSPSPTAAPTPYMPLDQVPNGNWDVIEQPLYQQIAYSRMTLKENGDAITGTWYVDKTTVYVLDGSRQGAHLTLQIKSAAAPNATVVGTMEADIDGIADMVGNITLGKVQVAFQGAQHGRVPAPVDAGTPAPEASPV